MRTPKKNLISCWICGERNPSHMLVRAGKRSEFHLRVCGSHTLREVQLFHKQGHRFYMTLDVAEDS